MADPPWTADIIRDDSPEARPGLLRPTARPRRTLDELVAAFGGERVRMREREVTHGTPALSGMSTASLDVVPGDLFVALPGGHVHGARYAARARAAGAVEMLTDSEGAAIARLSGLPTVVVQDPRGMLAAAAAWMFASDDAPPMLLGVTGTNGKTSTVYLLHSILERMGVIAGLSTTVERRMGDRSVVSILTTPEAPELHTLVESMREAGASAVALEVSAHGVSRGRIDGLLFDVIGFTNLSHDHLDEYAGMEEYFDAKAALFTPAHGRRAVVSIDTPYGARLAHRSGIPVTTISTSADRDADWIVEVIEERADSTAFTLASSGGEALETTIPLMGRHMAADAALAIVMLVEAGFSLSAVAAALGESALQVRIPGRSERVSGSRGPLVLVDFSHNGAAFEHTLRAMRRVTTGTLIMIVGADGEKDASKRPHMGRVSADHSDVLIITDHHPRREDPAAIRSALLAGAALSSRSAEAYEIERPADAIRAAVALAGPGDAILWAGPGMTDYRLIGSDRVPYSPHRDAREALREAGWL